MTSQVDTMPSVLVVDDDAAITRMMSWTLRDGGFDVDDAPNGEVALHQALRSAPDVIVLDLEMPVMDGRTFFRELRARGIDTPVIIVSAYEARTAQRQLGAEGYLDKPFNPDDLIAELRRLL